MPLKFLRFMFYISVFYAALSAIAQPPEYRKVLATASSKDMQVPSSALGKDITWKNVYSTLAMKQ